uniref:Gasdermin PUB domain-containing protein n=1 Tax=Balaenoptera musculus TaxID=9771 RepID=A0A8C0DW47_BALMU
RWLACNLQNRALLPNRRFVQPHSFIHSFVHARNKHLLRTYRATGTILSNFKHLQKEVSREMEAMAQLPKDIQDAILHNILARLKDREALQDLMDNLDRGLLDHLDGFGGTFLSEMQEDSRNLWLKLRLHIIYPLKAILVLSDTQHELQAWSMEKRILLQQRELVKSILEPNFKYPWNIPFTLDPKLLTTLQEEGVAVTFSLLEERNLRVAPDSPEGTGDLEAGKPLFALCGSLSALQQLLRPEPSPGRSVQRGLATPPSAR